MKTNILSSLEHLPYFTIQAVKQFFTNEGSKGTAQTAVYRWMKKDKLIKLKNGVYTSRKFFDLHHTDPDFPIMISSVLIPQSYISTHYILQRYSILTDVTYLITSITRKQSRMIENKLGSFQYSHIKDKLYTGYELTDYFGVTLAKATLAKALFDFLYLHPIPEKMLTKSINIADELRLNFDDLSKIDQEEFAEYVFLDGGPKMKAILTNFKEHVWRD
jgi:hypothetical protein